jgi:pilus assembly protein TadC
MTFPEFLVAMFVLGLFFSSFVSFLVLIIAILTIGIPRAIVYSTNILEKDKKGRFISKK